MPDRPSPSRGSLFERVGGVLPRGVGLDAVTDHAAKKQAEKTAIAFIANLALDEDDARRKRKKADFNVIRPRPASKLSDADKAVRRGKQKGRRRKAAKRLTEARTDTLTVRERQRAATKARRTNGT